MASRVNLEGGRVPNVLLSKAEPSQANLSLLPKCEATLLTDQCLNGRKIEVNSIYCVLPTNRTNVCLFFLQISIYLKWVSVACFSLLGKFSFCRDKSDY